MNSYKQVKYLQSLMMGAMILLVESTSLAVNQEKSDDPPKPITVPLTLSPTILDMDHLKASRMGFLPTTFALLAERPAGIVKEPDYVGTAKYGAFRIGNGPRSITYFAIDEAPGSDGKLYVDKNQNGDFTDDGPGDWDTVRIIGGNNNYITEVQVRASWGTPTHETDSGVYGLYVYKNHGANGGGYAKIGGREGNIKVGDKSYFVVLAENTNDGIFTVPAKGDLSRRHVEIYIDLDGDGTFQDVTTTMNDKKVTTSERFNVVEPFQIDGQWYLARPTISGDKLTLTPTDSPKKDDNVAKVLPE